jgi:ABC-type phosphate/phosphonate transport system substrate-binding protein
MKIRSVFPSPVLLGIVFLVWMGGASRSFAQTLPVYTAGVMTKSYDERRAKALEKFEEIIGKYIEDRAGTKIQLKSYTYPDLAKALEKGSIDFLWGYGLVVSMELCQRFPLLPVLAPTLGEDKRSLFKRLAVVTKDLAPSLSDFKGFKGKRLTYVGDEQWSFELLVFKVWAAERFGVKDITQFLSLKGRDPDEGFFIPASKRGAIYSLFIKEADIAVVHEFEYLTQERLTPNAIRDRAEALPLLANPSVGFMEAPLFVRKGVHKKEVDQIVKILIDMPSDPEGRQILLSSKMSGFARVVDQDYQPVRALLSKKESLGIR